MPSGVLRHREEILAGDLPDELGMVAVLRRVLGTNVLAGRGEMRALEAAAAACLAIGGAELATAERTARTLVELAPYRESGYRHLIDTLTARGNPAEGLLVYHELRTRLRDDLGVAPSPQTQELYRRLLGA